MMANTGTRIAATDTVHTGVLWRIKGGRSLYVQAAYRSRLDTALRELGARWDADQRALKISAAKLDAVLALLAEQAERRAAVEQVKAADHHVTVPYDATAIRDRAKTLAGVWDRGRKDWAMPTEAAHDEIAAAVQAWQADRDAARIAQRDAEQAAAAESVQQRRARLITVAGRVDTGETSEVRRISTRRMNKATAQGMAEPLGAIMVLRDGQRGMIIDVRVWFTGEDMASSACWHPETHDEAHWDWAYTVAVVEPSAADTAADQETADTEADTAELVDVMEQARRLAEPIELDDWTPAHGPRISLAYGSTGQDGGRLILDGDRAAYRHPGYYDDYRRSEAVITDTALVARVAALIARGPRSRRRGGDTYIVSEA